MSGFVHLHVHSHYSLLDGANRIDDLVATAHSDGQPALALTDHGNLFAAVEFYKAAAAAGVKPILGIEAFISPTRRDDRTMGNIQTAAYHLVLLAINETGWRNLMKLSSRSYLEGFYYRPRIDRELLSELNDGLVCTTACLGGEVPAALLSDQPKAARRIAGEYRDIFGADRFFIEVQNQGLADQEKVNPQLVALADQLGVGIVGTNDVHFLRREDKPAHEVLTAISTGKTLSDGGALEYSPEVYLKTQAEMRRALADLPGAADATLRIADMCDLKLDFTAKHLPAFDTPSGYSDDEYLGKLAADGLARRFAGRDVPEDYRDRLDWELKVIADKGYSAYFLIVNDFVQFARRNGIPAAPRGSGVATLLGYALGIADVDPIRYGLLFERFTDPARKEDPDMDIDICQEGRARVLQYVRDKYGHVAQIITFGTLKARAAVRDCARVLGMEVAEIDPVAKLVPEGPKVTLSSAMRTQPDLRDVYQADPRVKQVIDYALKLEGLARHAGVHAAGVVAAQRPLEELVPLYKQADSDDVITQWDGPTCDKVGLMKMDFLGLRTLTILQRCRELVRSRTGEDVDPEQIPLDDPGVYELFQRGQTDGVFQFESEGMKGVLTQMRPERIEDLIAANAMYRPGPMELIATYCARKNGLEPVPTVHRLVDDILAETYGVMTYQEQVMQVLNRLGKIPLNRALTLIKGISKKNDALVASQRSSFIEGAGENGIAQAEAEELYDLILRFAGYGFNKAHSTRYAILAYQTAYFKAHYPREFVAATLTFECGDTDKVVQYMTEARRLGVKIGPPDVNACGRDFTVDGEQVRFGLAAVRGVGAKAVEAVVAARDEAGRFKNLYHFCEHVDLRAVNRATVEALIKCGAFDALGASRAAMAAALDQAIALGQAAAADRRTGQLSLFAPGDDPAQPPRFPHVEPWSESRLLQAEKETLGFYVTSHPLTRYGRELTSLSTPDGVSLARLDAVGSGTGVTVGCMIASVRPRMTQRGRSAGKKMAMLTVEDLTGKAEAVVFADAYERYAGLLKPETMVFLRGSVDRRRDRPSIKVDEVIAIDRALAELTGSIHLRLPPGAPAELLERLKALLAAHKGKAAVRVELRPTRRADVRATVRLGEAWSVKPTRRLVAELIDLLGGEEQLLLRPRRAPAGWGNGNGRRFYRRPRSAAGGSYAASPPASEAVTRFD